MIPRSVNWVLHFYLFIFIFFHSIATAVAVTVTTTTTVKRLPVHANNFIYEIGWQIGRKFVFGRPKNTETIWIKTVSSWRHHHRHVFIYRHHHHHHPILLNGLSSLPLIHCCCSNWFLHTLAPNWLVHTHTYISDAATEHLLRWSYCMDCCCCCCRKLPEIRQTNVDTW